MSEWIISDETSSLMQKYGICSYTGVVIRCRDCDFSSPHTSRRLLCGLRKSIGYFVVKPNGFCSSAKVRKRDDQ